MDQSMIGKTRWSRNHWLAILVVAAFVWGLFALSGPGDDYKRCYTWMVVEPWRLPKVAEGPWTLNPPWLAPLMAPFVSIPGRAGYLVFMAATIAMVIYTTYVLGGKPIPILLSAYMAWILWWGQIEGWGLLAVVLGWLAMQRKNWPLMFLALAMASFKPQIGFLPVLALWWWSGPDRWKSMTALFALLGFSLLAWGPWPLWYWQGIFGFVGDRHFMSWNASLGLVALPLLIPAIFLPLNREQRLIALTASVYVISPYMPFYSTILLLSFAVPGWAYLFGFLAYLPLVIGTRLAWNGVVLMPLLVLVWLYWPILRSWLQRRRGAKLSSQENDGNADSA